MDTINLITELLLPRTRAKLFHKFKLSESMIVQITEYCNFRPTYLKIAKILQLLGVASPDPPQILPLDYNVPYLAPL